ncbi:hypothetical protein [Rhizobacter sp. Root1221]|uniref:hypothetical protein n=1 Tax=Rhizobacter sp. Root1221 TaxID=1736433 RepID=UPI0006F5883E|nr:hypothetical protein [Rhizobacter sp. Root1221]KQV94032.1 hypothetical protein ASC87_26640 [Rhizobacter sp. Root1221]
MDEGVPAYDVVLRRHVDGRQAELLRARYGQARVYAVTKRQLGGPVLRAHGLRSDAEVGGAGAPPT